jgi:hypothetical protein
VIQPILPLLECADHAPSEFATEPLNSIADSTAEEATIVESAVETLHSATNPASYGAALTETFCLYIWI